jgi:2'-5' RNA ligase
MRAFLAIELPSDIKEHLSTIVKSMSQRIPGVKWVRAEGQHVTLKFFGEISDNKVQEIIGITADIGGQHAAIPAQLKEINAFPDLRRPRVIVATFQEGVDNVRAIFHDIENRLSILGIAKEQREFTPHITLGRIKVPPPLLRKDMLPLEEKSFFGESRSLPEHINERRGAVYSA